MSRRGMLPLLAIEAASLYYRLPWKPPVTAALIAANTLIHARPKSLRRVIPPIEDVWFNPHLILKYKNWKRLLLSPFYHVEDAHLFYNMVSLLWKGVRLETRFGSLEFASMVGTLLVMSQGITLVLSKLLLVLFEEGTPFYREYAVGFSGVLFAMKVVLNSGPGSDDDVEFVHGMVVPTKYAAWAELVLVQMFVPGVSFWGHLGGLLAGILYVKIREFYSGGSDPLVRVGKGILGWVMRLLRWRPRRWMGRGRVSGGVWRCGACTFDNSGWLSVCEMCGTRRGADDAPLYSSEREMDAEEIRRRRIQRFSR